MSQAQALPAYQYHDHDPSHVDMLQEVLAGLSAVPKTISPKYFYDARGAKLFEEITAQPEYYLTNAEMEIIGENCTEIAACLGENTALIEYGSGVACKAGALIEAARPGAYMAVDISKKQLEEAAQRMAATYDWLKVHAICTDFTREFSVPESQARKIVFFPGSSLGNFSPDAATKLMRSIRSLIGPEGGALIGVDMHKPAHILNAAYNDSAGITREFNLNILRHLNHALGADFHLDAFAHEARYNVDIERMEMHLRCLRPQQVALGDRIFAFHEGDRIHTESSYKFREERFLEMSRSIGFSEHRVWTDRRRYCSLFYLHGS